MIEKITKDKGGFKPRPRLHDMNPCSSEKIVKTLWGMKKDQLAESTIEVTGRRLRLMAKSVDLDNPDAVTEYLATKEGKNSYIESLANAYYRYTKYNNIDWDQPIIKRSSQPPYEVDVEIMKKIVAVLKKYPVEYEQAKILIKKMIDKLSQLIID